MSFRTEWVSMRIPLIALSIGLLLAACGRGVGQSGNFSGVSDETGTARVEADGAIIEFETLSGLTGERLIGVEVDIVSVSGAQFFVASDPTGLHAMVAAPLDSGSTVRRLLLPPVTQQGYNFATATGTLDLTTLEELGVLDEEELRRWLRRGPDEVTLLYLYDPTGPLALTNASLEAFTPSGLDGVMVLRAPAQSMDVALGYVIVSLTEPAFETWEHRSVDRYMTGRIGQPPVTDLRSDLTFGWSYPVFDVFPDGDSLTLAADESAELTVSWRAQYPDPPPPWSFVINAAQPELLQVEPESFALSPGSPPQTVTVRVDRTGLDAGEYETRLFIQPYSDAFGLVEQTIEQTVTFTVGVAPPTPTPGESAALAFTPQQPREGDTLTITAQGFEANESILVELIGPGLPVSDARPTADPQGAITYNLDLASASAGNYILRLTGAISGIVAEAEVTVTEQVADAIVRTGELNLRTGPTFEYPVVDILADGDELTVIGVNADDSWLEVVTVTGTTGWVVSDLVEINIDLATVPWNPNVPPPP